MKISYLGPQGSFSEKAYRKMWPDQTGHEITLAQDLLHLLQSLIAGEIDVAVMPLWNSSGGFLKDRDTHKSYLQTMFDAKCCYRIVSEYFLPQDYCLMAVSGNGDDVQCLHVNPYAEKQCEAFIAGKGWKIITHDSSSAAAKAAQENGAGHAALASHGAATTYELQIMVPDVIEPPYMHFVSLTTQPEIHIDLSVSEAPISSFAMSSPDKNAPEPTIENAAIRSEPLTDTNLYLIDLPGERSEQHLKALAQGDFFYLGTYPADVESRKVLFG